MSSRFSFMNLISISCKLKNLLDWIFCAVRGENPHDDKNLIKDLKEGVGKMSSAKKSVDFIAPSTDDAIEVLKELKEEVNFADMHKDRVIRLNALGVTLLALEKQEGLVYDLLFLANKSKDDIITGNKIISLLLKNKIEIEQEKGFIWKRKEGVKKYE